MKILHLIDDEKFTDFIIEQSLKYKQVLSCNLEHYFLLNNDKLNYTKSDYSNLILKQSFKEYYDYIAENNFKIIIVHCLTMHKCQALRKVNFNYKTLVWGVWGVDFYGSHLYKKNILTNRNLIFQNNIKSLKTNLKDFFRPFYYFFRYGSTHEYSFEKVIKNVSFISPVIEDEYEIITNTLNINPRQIRFPYGSSAYLNDFYFRNESLGNNILIGNSAALECNHLDVFDKLNSISKEFKEIIVPLNYAGFPKYLNKVIREGKKLFGSNFKPILNFLSYDLYCKELLSCNVSIFGHLRQQALGNIIISIYFGHKVFFYEANPLFLFFKRKGYEVFSLEKDFNDSEVNNELPEKLKLRNKSLIDSEFGEKAIKNKFDDFYNEIIKHHIAKT